MSKSRLHLIMLLTLSVFIIPSYSMNSDESTDESSEIIREDDPSDIEGDTRSSESLEDTYTTIGRGLEFGSHIEELNLKLTEEYMESIRAKTEDLKESIFEELIKKHQITIEELYKEYQNLPDLFKGILPEKMSFDTFVNVLLIYPAKKDVLIKLISKCEKLFEKAGEWELKKAKERENIKEDRLKILKKITFYDNCYMKLHKSLLIDLNENKEFLKHDYFDDRLNEEVLNLYLKEWNDAKDLLKVRINRIASQEESPSTKDVVTTLPRQVLQMIFREAQSPINVRSVCKKFKDTWDKDPKNTKFQMLQDKKGLDKTTVTFVMSTMEALKNSTKQLDTLMNETTKFYLCTVYKCDFDQLNLIFSKLKDEIISNIKNCLPVDKVSSQSSLETWIGQDMPDTLKYLFLLNQLMHIQNHQEHKTKGLGEKYYIKESRTAKVLKTIQTMSQGLTNKDYKNDILTFVEIIKTEKKDSYRTQEMIDIKAKEILAMVYEKFINEILFPKRK